MKTPEQIAELAASKVIADNLDNMGEDYNPEGDPIVQLAWELGEGIEYEDGLKQLVAAAIEADRAQNPGPSFAEIDAMLAEWEIYSGDVSAFIQRFEDAWAR